MFKNRGSICCKNSISLFPSIRVTRRKRLLFGAKIVFLLLFVYTIYSVTRSTAGLYNPEISDTRKIFMYELLIKELRKRNSEHVGKPSEFYQKRPETQHVDCGKVMEGDQEYISTINGKNRVMLIEDPAINMSCSEVVRRINPFPNRLKPLKSGVAFARIVYKDYEFIEKQVHMSYHPQNVFCFAIDQKSTPDFQEKVQKMASCFDNMHVLPVVEKFDSRGHNYNLVNTKFMRKMLTFPGWNYILLLQNHDVITKTVYEIVRIYELLGGANDISVYPEQGRVDWNFAWDPRSLRLFRNESGFSERLLTAPMKFAKGYSQVSVSRAAANWFVNTVNLDLFISQWNQSDYASDEQFMASFQINSEFGMPGHFTDECLKQGISTEHVSRMTQWVDPREYERCATKTVRHWICLLGIEDLRTVAAYPNIMFNKMLPSFDYSIVECTAELLFNRTFLGQTDHMLDEQYYSNMVHVLYHKHHKEPGYRLNCTPSLTPWSQMKYPL